MSLAPEVQYALEYVPSLRDLLNSVAYVQGQLEVKKRLAWALRRQLLVAYGKLPNSPAGAIATGSTGVGKTYLTRMMCSSLNLPFAEVKATQYTDKGYIGPDLEQMFIHLFQAAADQIDGQYRPGAYRQDVDAELFKRGDLEDVIERASTGVIMLDEFDKWMHQTKLDDHGRNKGRALQYELLTILEGATVWVTDREEELGEKFDTSKVFFVACGAFYGPPSLASVLKRRLRREEPEAIHGRPEQPPWELLEPIDFQTFGVIPELTGRLAIHFPFVDLQMTEMQAILMEEGGIVEEYIARAREEGIDLRFDDGALLAVGDVASQRDAGARGLRHVLEGLLAKPLVETALAGDSRLVVTAQHVRMGNVSR